LTNDEGDKYDDRSEASIPFNQVKSMTYALALFQAPVQPEARGPIFGYIPIIIFFLIAVLLPVVLLGVSRLVQRRVFERNKLMPYECGVDPIGDARERFSVRFYIVAMLFLVFDVEVVFLFPWAVIYDRLALFGLIEMLIFIGILIVGYYYAWRKGALEWA
jgi:NADH-quinone oxidoreductase subunit A